MRINEIKDKFYIFKVWYGMKFLGWFKPLGWDYGKFIDFQTCMLVKRDETGIIHRKMQIFPKSGVDIELT